MYKLEIFTEDSHHERKPLVVDFYKRRWVARLVGFFIRLRFGSSFTKYQKQLCTAVSACSIKDLLVQSVLQARHLKN